MSLTVAGRGEVLAVVGTEGRLQLWRADDLALVVDVQLAGTGTTVVAGDEVALSLPDGGTWTLAPDPAAWVEAACAVAGRNLTAGEWQATFDERPYQATWLSLPSG